MARSYGGIAHKWAAQNPSKPNGKNGNIFYESDSIYSYGYHFKIARFVDPSTVFFTTDNYSSSTHRHKAAVEDALRGLEVRVFKVPDLDAGWSGNHRKNIEYYREEFSKELQAAARAIKYKDWHIQAAERLRAEAIRYAAKFDLGAGVEFPAISVELLEEARAARQRIAAENRERDKKAKAELEAKMAKLLPKWLAGENVELPYEHGDTQLRLIEEGATIQTSRGARVPREVAPQLWDIVKQCRKLGSSMSECFSNRIVQRVGDFQLRECSKEGDLTIGCHHLKYEVLAKFAERIGLAKEA